MPSSLADTAVAKCSCDYNPTQSPMDPSSGTPSVCVTVGLPSRWIRISGLSTLNSCSCFYGGLFKLAMNLNIHESCCVWQLWVLSHGTNSGFLCHCLSLTSNFQSDGFMSSISHYLQTTTTTKVQFSVCPAFSLLHLNCRERGSESCSLSPSARAFGPPVPEPASRRVYFQGWQLQTQMGDWEMEDLGRFALTPPTHRLVQPREVPGITKQEAVRNKTVYCHRCS